MVDDGKLDVLDRVGLQVLSWVVPNFPPTGLDSRGSLGVPIPGDDILLTLKGKKTGKSSLLLLQHSASCTKRSYTLPKEGFRSDALEESFSVNGSLK